MVTHETINYFPNQKSVKNTKLYQCSTRDYPTVNKGISSDGDFNVTTYKYAQEKNDTKLNNTTMIRIPWETDIKSFKNHYKN